MPLRPAARGYDEEESIYGNDDGMRINLDKVKAECCYVHDGDCIVQSSAVGDKVGQMLGEQVGNRPNGRRFAATIRFGGTSIALDLLGTQ